VPETEFVVAAPHLGLPVGSQSKRSVPAANGVFPIVLEALRGLN